VRWRGRDARPPQPVPAIPEKGIREVAMRRSVVWTREKGAADQRDPLVSAACLNRQRAE
jgi:hypothetical protein